MIIRKIKKYSVWISAIALTVNIFTTKSSFISKVNAYDYPAGISSVPQIAIVSGTPSTIQATWQMDFQKIWTDVLKYNADVIGNPSIEIKFLVTIDGHPLNTTSLQDGQTANGGLRLNTSPTRYGEVWYNSYDGTIIEGQTANNQAPFQIYASFTDQRKYSFRLIDNITIMQTDPGLTKNHTYVFQPLININSETGLVPPATTGTFQPGQTAPAVHNVQWYKDHYFVGATNFFVGTGGTNMTVAGNDSTIYIPGYSGNGRSRPGTTFKLKYINSYSGWSVRNSNELIFVSQDPNLSNLAILVNDGFTGSETNCSQNRAYPFAVLSVTPGQNNAKDAVTWQTFSDSGQGVDLWFAGISMDDKPIKKPDGNVYYKFLESIYTTGPYGQDKCPDSGELNENARQLLATDARNTSQTQEEPGASACERTCKGNVIVHAFCVAQCAMLDYLGDIVRKLLDWALKPVLGL